MADAIPVPAQRESLTQKIEGMPSWPEFAARFERRAEKKAAAPEKQPAPEGSPADAVEEGQEQASDQPEHSGAQGDGASAEAGGGDRDAAGGQESQSQKQQQERAQFEALAKKFGLVVDESRVVPAERAQLRNQRRRELAAIAKEREALEAARTEHAQIDKARQAWAWGDYLATLEALGVTRDDVNAAQAAAINPQAKAQLEMQRKLEKLEQERAETLRQEQERQEQARLERVRAEHRQEIHQSLAAHSDPELRRLAGCAPVIEHARAWLESVERDPHLLPGEPHPTLEDALAVVTPQFRNVYETLHRVFGNQPPATAESGGDSAGVRGTDTNRESGATMATGAGQDSETHPATRKTKHVPARSAAGVSAQQPKHWESWTLLRKAREATLLRLMAEAMAADEQ